MSSSNGSARSASPVALVTGGASGMGLGVVERLLQLGWNVAIVDFDEKAATQVTQRLGEKTIFIKANVIDYEQQANAFVKTFERWNRIDLVYANAGIGDRIDFYAPATELLANGAPKKPDSLVVDICLYGCIWASYLAMHYFRMNPDGAGKIVMTSSMCGIYVGDSIPLYTAAKHGVVGLTRAMARKLAKSGGNVTVNCLCPGLVPTPLVGILPEVCPPEYQTPVSTIVRAVEAFATDGTLTGKVAECSGEKVYYRDMLEYSDPAAEFIMRGDDQGIQGKLKGRSPVTKELLEKGRMLQEVMELHEVQ